MVVDFPAPFGPRKPCTSPVATSRSRPSRAWVLPKDLCSPETTMAEVMFQKVHFIQKFVNLSNVSLTCQVFRSPGGDDGVVSAQRDDEAVQRYAEQFGNLLAETGWPRMAARVFAAILGSEPGRMTAAELSEQLQASPAAISGAVRYLEQMRLASRERDPGSRRDVYVVQDDFWYQSMMRQDRFL